MTYLAISLCITICSLIMLGVYKYVVSIKESPNNIDTAEDDQEFLTIAFCLIAPGINILSLLFLTLLVISAIQEFRDTSNQMFVCECGMLNRWHQTLYLEKVNKGAEVEIKYHCSHCGSGSLTLIEDFKTSVPFAPKFNIKQTIQFLGTLKKRKKVLNKKGSLIQLEEQLLKEQELIDRHLQIFIDKQVSALTEHFRKDYR